MPVTHFVKQWDKPALKGLKGNSLNFKANWIFSNDLELPMPYKYIKNNNYKKLCNDNYKFEAGLKQHQILAEP